MKKIITILMVLAMMVSCIPIVGNRSIAAENSLTIKKLEINGDGEINYTISGDSLYVELHSTKPGLVSLYTTISGIEKQAILGLYGGTLEQLSEGVRARDAGDSSVLTNMLIGFREFRQNVEESSFYFGNESEEYAVLVVNIANSVRTIGETVNLNLRASYTDIITEGTDIESGKEYTYAQSPGSLYWPIKIESTSRIICDSYDCSLCKSDKSVIDDYKKIFIVKPGTYYLKTENRCNRAIIMRFSCNISEIEEQDLDNTTKNTATNVELNKTCTGILTSSPKFKPHFYKLKMTKNKKITMKYNNDYENMLEVEIYTKHGKWIGTCYTDGKKGTTKYFFDSDAKHVKKLNLKKGCYYIKVKKYWNSSEDGIFNIRFV